MSQPSVEVSGAYYLPNRFQNPDELSVKLSVLVIAYPPASFREKPSPPTYILFYNTFLGTVSGNLYKI